MPNALTQFDNVTVYQTAGELPECFTLVTDSQEVDAITDYFPNAKDEDYSAYFVGDTSTGDYLQVYGIHTICPGDHTRLERVDVN